MTLRSITIEGAESRATGRDEDKYIYDLTKLIETKVKIARVQKIECHITLDGLFK